MNAEIIDISRPLFPGIAVWPGDTPFSIITTLSRRQGQAVNLTTLTLSAHTGSHADAPFHFADAGATLEHVQLRPYWGAAQVVTVNKENEPLQPQDFEDYDLTRAARLLVRTPVGSLPLSKFPEAIPYPSPELAAHLAAAGIVLYGTDAPSMDTLESTDLPGHQAMLAHGVAILEGLDLRQAPDGLYELVALPLNIVGGDGSPVRAALRPLN